MQIKVIGSGSMWTGYNSSAYLIDDDILVDIGNGTCKALYRMGTNPVKIRHVLITHFHGDHYFDMPFYLLYKSKSDDKNANIYCSKEGKRKINKLLHLSFPSSDKNIKKETNIKFNYCNTFKINDYDVNKYLVDHGSMKPAYGYVFDKNNLKVGFTGDTALCETVKYMAKICAYLFIDCTFLKSTTKHIGVDKLEYLTKEYSNCKFVVSHLNDETREYLKNIKLKNIIIPEDGTVIDI